MSTDSKYSRNNPYHSRVLVNQRMTLADSEKETRHYELELEPGMHYTPGDAIGILPENRPHAVHELLETLGYTGEERVLDHYKVEISLHEAVRTRLGIGKLSRGSVTALAKMADGHPKADELRKYTLPENRSLAEEYVWGREFIDLITEFPGIIKNPQDLFTVLQRLTPRMYSIASSQEMNPNAVHTIVRVIRYDTHGRERQGLCSGHLAERAPHGQKMPVFLHENKNFRLPEDSNAPIIMIGPGTGIAPFRAFLQHRQALGHKGKNWLFFGEQRRSSDFLYQSDLEAWHKDGLLNNFHTAFSRDQKQKVYVQDRMREHAAELYKWLEEGAYFYVCGDASRMAKDVENALLDAIAMGKHGTLDDANAYLAEMKKQKRYQRDVY